MSPLWTNPRILAVQKLPEQIDGLKEFMFSATCGHAKVTAWEIFMTFATALQDFPVFPTSVSLF